MKILNKWSVEIINIINRMKQQRKKEKMMDKKGMKNRSPSNYKAKQNVKVEYKKKGGKEVEQLPTIQNMLQIPKQERASKTFEYFKKVKPFLHSYIQKKQGSRAVQLMFKWGNAEIKSQIYKDILQHWKQLIKSSYALHLISKVAIQFEFPQLVEDSIALQNHKQGSMVLQHFIHKNPNSPKVTQIISKFQSIQKQFKEKGFQSQQILHNLAIKSIQKQYFGNRISKLVLKLALPTMIIEQRNKVIQFFAQKSIQLLNDDEGVKLFVLIFNYMDSKQKKNIITKQVKGHVKQILHQSSISYIALIKLLTEVDDTVMVGNKVVPELLNQIQQVCQNNSKIYHVLISLFSSRNNNFNCLGKIQKIVGFTNCKKQQQVRKSEIRQYVYPDLIQYLIKDQNIRNTCSHPNLSRLALGLIKSLQSDGQDFLKTFATAILKYFLADLQQKKTSGTKKINIQQSLVAHNFGSKLIKNILLLQQSFIDKYSDKFAQIFRNNLQKVLNSNASFVLTILIQKGNNELLQQIKRSKIDLTKVKAADFYQQRLKPKSK